MPFPNQRIITISKRKGDKKNLYTSICLDALDEAGKTLKQKASMKLYIYFVKNQNNYNFELSSKDFCEWSGCSIEAYRTAFKELIEKEFLHKTNIDGSNEYYIFYDKPPEKQSKISNKSNDNIKAKQEFTF